MAEIEIDEHFYKIISNMAKKKNTSETKILEDILEKGIEKWKENPAKK